eukprot:TRINITY_DN2365_c0_g1_i3.p1 TRINITY_DN2365_c0_g1~~TRINITY_DN2365_c0_g1_i3.p1  ORF type:complete len:103 (-),score=5.87 TRINITY_DN2365_c0_g1_i3:277-585(-)
MGDQRWQEFYLFSTTTAGHTWHMAQSTPQAIQQDDTPPHKPPQPPMMLYRSDDGRSTVARVLFVFDDDGGTHLAHGPVHPASHPTGRYTTTQAAATSHDALP